MTSLLFKIDSQYKERRNMEYFNLTSINVDIIGYMNLF